jgi:hypothetical protein
MKTIVAWISSLNEFIQAALATVLIVAGTICYHSTLSTIERLFEPALNQQIAANLHIAQMMKKTLNASGDYSYKSDMIMKFAEQLQ